jgi:FlaG/FlaF family flagellin (archaellin)
MRCDRTRDARAQAESIGVVLLVGVVVLSATAFGVFYLDTAVDERRADAGGDVGGTRTANVDGTVTTDGLRMRHLGGDSLDVDALDVDVVVNGSDTGLGWSAGELSGSTASTFDSGEQWRLDRSYDRNATVTVRLVYEETNEILFSETRNPTDPAAASARNGVGDSEVGGGDEDGRDGGEGDAGDDGDGDGGGDAPEGEPGLVDDPGSPWLDVDDDGAYETDEGDVTVDLSGGQVPRTHADTAEDATLVVPSGYPVDAWKVDLRAENLTIESDLRSDRKMELRAEAGDVFVGPDTTLRSTGKMEVTGPEGVVLDGATLDTTPGNGKLEVAAGDGAVSARETTTRTRGKLEITGRDGVVLVRATIDTTGGNGKLEVTAEAGTVVAADVVARTRSKLDLSGGTGVNVAGGTLDTTGGNGKLSVTSESGPVVATETTARTRSKFELVALRDVAATNALIDTTGGNGKLSIESEEANVSARDATLQTRARLSLDARSDLELSNSTLANDGGNSDVELTAERGSVNASDVRIGSRGSVGVESGGTLTLSRATVDNAGGTSDVTLESDGNASLVGATLRSRGDASVDVGDDGNGPPDHANDDDGDDGNGPPDHANDDDGDDGNGPPDHANDDDGDDGNGPPDHANDEEDRSEPVVDVSDAVLDDADDSLDVEPDGAAVGSPADGYGVE